MKNVFGLNKTYYGEDRAESFDGARFISASLSEEAEVTSTPKNEIPQLPALLSVLQYIFVALFAISLGIWISSGRTLDYHWKNSIYVPLLMAIGFLGFVVISVIDVVRSKRYAKENGIENLSELEEYGDIHEVDEEAEAAEAARVKSELGIPDNAIDMDFLSFFYRESDDGPVPYKSFDFMTMEMFVYNDDEFLHIADYSNVYSIPKSDIKSFEKIEKSVLVLGWSKEENFDSDAYAPYKMTETEEGYISLPYYYSIAINTDGENFLLTIPPYEAEKLSDMLKLEK